MVGGGAGGGDAGGSPAAAAKRGRPRSENVRLAVLEAVDDLLVEQGYANLTMKGIAERAGVGRQTLYRWWNSPAEVLFEASAQDAREDLALEATAGPPVPETTADPEAELTAYLHRLAAFLVDPAGHAYRALLGAAQQDAEVRALLDGADVPTPSAVEALDRARSHLPEMPPASLAVAQLVGPAVFHALTTQEAWSAAEINQHVAGLLRAWGAGRA